MEHKDYLGNELKIGDLVAYSPTSNAIVCVGEITELSRQYAKIQCVASPYMLDGRAAKPRNKEKRGLVKLGYDPRNMET